MELFEDQNIENHGRQWMHSSRSTLLPCEHLNGVVFHVITWGLLKKRTHKKSTKKTISAKIAGKKRVFGFLLMHIEEMKVMISMKLSMLQQQ